MAHATVKGQRHEVRVTQDLGENFNLEVYALPPAGTRKVSEPFKNWPVPLVLKLKADSAAHALEFGLAHLKTLGRIDGYEIAESERPPPPPPPKAPAAAAPPATPAADPAAKPVS